MNECCEQTLEKEWKEIRKWKPFLHYCHSAWDGLLIDKGDPEFECCTCFPTKNLIYKSDPHVSENEVYLMDDKGNVLVTIINVGDKK